MAENFQRKDFTPSEAVAIRRMLEPTIATPVGRPLKVNNGGKLPPIERGKTRDKVAAFTGVAARTLKKADALVASSPQRQGVASCHMFNGAAAKFAYIIVHMLN